MSVYVRREYVVTKPFIYGPSYTINLQKDAANNTTQQQIFVRNSNFQCYYRLELNRWNCQYLNNVDFCAGQHIWIFGGTSSNKDPNTLRRSSKTQDISTTSVRHGPYGNQETKETKRIIVTSHQEIHCRQIQGWRDKTCSFYQEIYQVSRWGKSIDSCEG